MLSPMACVIDWPGTASFIRDVIVSAATIITATVAIKGINKWRSEESGKADFDLSRRIGKAVFRLRDVMRNARNSAMFGYEFPDGYDSLRATPEQKASAMAHAFSNRWKPISECAVEILSLRNEAEALWGNTIIARLDKLLTLANRWQTATSAHIRNAEADGQHFAKNPDFGRKINAQVFDTGNELNDDGSEGASNAFTTELNEAIADAAAYLRTKLPRPD
jgi:hypothetical protein